MQGLPEADQSNEYTGREYKRGYMCNVSHEAIRILFPICVRVFHAGPVSQPLHTVYRIPLHTVLCKMEQNGSGPKSNFLW